MPRTLNPVANTLRRDAFVDVAQRLIQVKGYEEMSIQDVLDELDASKGAFYHYFDSKQALLQAVVDRMVDVVAAGLTKAATDPGLAAPEKLAVFFSGITQWKNDQREFILELIKVWVSDENAIVREKLRRGVTTRLTPLMAEIVRQGTEEGIFAAGSPDHAATVLVSLILGLNEVATQLFLARQANTVTTAEVVGTIGVYLGAFERILGAPAGSLGPVDEATIHLWFD